MTERSRARSVARAGALATILALAAGPAAAQDRQVVIATTGGAYEQAMREAWFDPFTRDTGIRVVTVSASGGESRARAAAMVKADNVAWDLMLINVINAEAADAKDYLDDISPFCAAHADDPALFEDSCTGAGLMTNYTATLLAYAGDRFEGRTPHGWDDFWDLEAFPGPRALPNFGDPWRVLAAALLADGVAPDALFPLDVDRAFRKLDTIRESVAVWWKTGDQSVQQFRSGDYVMGMIWQTRANALIREGQKVKYNLDQAFMIGERVSLLRGAPNRDNALALLDWYIGSPAAQAKICELGCLPANKAAIPLLSDALRENLPAPDEIMTETVPFDTAWILATREALLERWNSWLLQ